MTDPSPEAHADAPSRRPVIAVMGAGEATGGAIAKRFAREGFTACLARRRAAELEPLKASIEAEGGHAHAFGVDGRDEAQVVAWFETIERDIGPVDVAVFNVGGNVRYPIVETTERVFRKVWEMACYAGFLTGREAARHMIPRGAGTIFFTGATASVRGGSGFAAFSSAKHGLRAVAQSMARELGPMGIHVMHTVIDGPIDTPWINENFPQIKETRGPEGLLNPDHIAETYWLLHTQPRDSWTFEVDMRPSVEPW